MRDQTLNAKLIKILLVLSWLGATSAGAETSTLPPQSKKPTFKKSYRGAAIKVKVVKPRVRQAKKSDVDAQVQKAEEGMDSAQKMTEDQLHLQAAAERESKQAAILSKVSKKKHETDANSVKNMK